MSSTTTPLLHISFDFAETLLLRLDAAAKATGDPSYLEAAKILQAEIDAQIRIVQPEH
ncbi:hypothetical protein [Geothrix sp. 21YS21S-2]|uniref:hypothetical protein n=1 Tax=Geothrix sp. 21YS21S-2 TaxID=3068893 RepID=UPI0027BB0CEA|nr:hypothetical protein [Geothrix sp. 21YS21S-2]